MGLYEVVAALGVGGMGEVYRARDTALHRDVAIKVLPELFATDPDRLARFQREAQVLASLNHPHIAHIHGLEQSGGVRALVMELVEGEDLAQRIARGALPLDEALPIARQIADAVEAAHEQGIVHRDLKPANIKVRADGTVKVLDFGLAKALEPIANAPRGSAPLGSATDVSHAPTLTSPAMLTGVGVILGTAAYMSPEQARGKAVDKRSDIWAFGTVLFEMLTGTRAFEGEEVTDVVAAVVRDEPKWNRLPANTPSSIRRLLRRSLQKDRKQRLADFSDVRLELDDTAAEGPPRDDTPARARPIVWRERAWAMLAIASLLALAVVAISSFRTPVAEAPMRFEVAPPLGGSLEYGQPLSPDGRTLAFISSAEGKSLIWIRPLDAGAARALPGTEGASRSFWSPDSQQVAFFTDGNLKRVAIAGGRPQLIANGPFRDGAWSTNGVILVGGQAGRPLMRVSDLGGEPAAETTLDASAEISHDYPEFLPDGRHYIYMVRGRGSLDTWTSYVGTIGSTERHPLPGIRGAVKYSPSGHLLFLRNGTLIAQAFNLDRLQLAGDPFPIADQVAGGRVATFSVSKNDMLAFHGGLTSESQFMWFDRSGTRLGPVGPTAVYRSPTLSADDQFVAFERGSPSDVWVLDLKRASASRVVPDGAQDRAPVWSPTGQMIAFASDRGGFHGIYERNVGGGGVEKLLTKTELPVTLTDWSRDGQYLAYSSGGEIWALPLVGSAAPLQLTRSPLTSDQDARFSPDGHWIAYQSEQSSGLSRADEGDVFVQSFPKPDITRQASTAGGFVPRWSDDGKELFYLARDGTLMAAPISSRASALDIGQPRPLFRPRAEPLGIRYSVASDGRFLIPEGASDLSITVIVNWFQQLKSRTKD